MTDYFERTAKLNITREPGEDGDKLRFHASLSSEQPAPQLFDGMVVNEILRHSNDAINLDRANVDGLPLLFNHDINAPIGRVRNIKLVNNRLEGDIRFSTNSERGATLAKEVEDGFLSDVSLKYTIQDYDRPGNGDDLVVTRFTPMEVSLVTIPADPTVGINRSMETKDMDGPTDTGGGIDVADFQARYAEAVRTGKRDGAELERQRVADIDTIFAMQRTQTPAFQALRAECIRKGSTPDQARAAVLGLIDSEPDTTTVTPPAPDTQTRDVNVTAGDDQLDKFDVGAQRSLDLRLGFLDRDESRAERASNQFVGMPLAEIAREYLRRANVDVDGLNRHDMVGRALRPELYYTRDAFVGHGTSSFTNLLANVANKSLLRGYDEAPETWDRWCRVGETPDFRQAQRSGLSQFDDLDTIPENGEYQHGTMDDRMEPLTPTKRGKLFAITREAILADDLNGLSVAPRRMGRAAARSVGDSAYAVLTANAVLNQDATALFDAGHSNIGATGAGPTVATLDEMRVLMALQTDSNSNAAGLNIQPAIIVCPVAWQTQAEVLVASLVDPVGVTGAIGGAVRPNPFTGLQVVADPRLDAASSTVWYLVADPNVTDTVEVAFVEGRREPFLESRDGWTVDGIEYKVRIEAGAAALDFRGMTRNPGA